MANVSFYGSGTGQALGMSPIQRDYMIDPRRAMAEQLMAQGSSTAPVQSPLEGLARALTAGVGGYYAGQARKDMQGRENRLGGDMAKILAGANAQPWVNPDTGQTSDAPAGGYEGMMAAGQNIQNPDVVPFIQQMQMQGAQRNQDLADYKQKLELQKEIGFGPNMPSSLQEWAEFQKMTPQEKDQYLLMKRANPYLNLGGTMAQPSPSQPGQKLGEIVVTPKPEQMPEFRADVVTAEEGAKSAAKVRADYESKGVKSNQALNALVGVEDLIEKSTGSWGGAALDTVAAVFGAAPEGALNVGKLKVIQANLMLSQPRMEGPQSDRDVNLYREAAGQIGDPTVPNEIKLAAVQTIKALHSKYTTNQNMNVTTSPMPIYGNNADAPDPLGIR